MPRGRPKLEFHPIQLTGVWAASISGVRRNVRDGDPDEPTFDAQNPRTIRLMADGMGFSCQVRAAVLIPVFEGELFEGRIDVVGQFATIGDSPLSLNLARAFCRRQALFLLWPFARAFLDQAAMIVGVGIPPLPMVVRPDQER